MLGDLECILQKRQKRARTQHLEVTTVQFEETDDDEPAQPDDVLATQQEIVAEVERCRQDPASERRLMKAALLILKTTTVLKGRFLPDDLLQDALVALLTGRRSWKKNRVDFIWLVMGVMKSLASSRDNSLETKDGHVVLEGELRAKDDENDGDSIVETFGDADASPEALLLQAEQKAEEDSVFVDMTAKVLQSRRLKLSEYLADIRVGRFPADPAPRRCPNCPAFFICGLTPPGLLTRSF
jgi:hypothetical protein